MEEVPPQHLSSQGNEQPVIQNNNSLIKKLVVSLSILIVIFVIGKSLFFVKSTEKLPITQTENSSATTSEDVAISTVNNWEYYYIGSDGVVSFDRFFVIKGADPLTFQEIGYRWAKDKNNVYLQGQIISFLDPETVKALSFNYVVDSKGVFAYDPNIGTVFGTDADRTTFSFIGDKYGKDKSSVYFLGKKNANLDALSFTLLSSPGDPQFLEHDHGFGYAKDKNYVYFNKVIISNADVLSFIFLGNRYAKDKNNVYYEGKVIVDADPASFIGLFGEGSWYYAKDKNNAYYEGRVVAGADSTTFASMYAHNYAKDGNHIFREGSMLNIEIDPTKLEFVDDSGLVIKDNKRVYFQAHVFNDYHPISYFSIDADAPTFQYIGDCNTRAEYYKDKNHVYIDSYQGEVKRVDAIDVSSFEYLGLYGSYVFEGDSHLVISYAKDKNDVYVSCGDLLAGANASTFVDLGDGYAKDKNKVWYLADVINGADAATFRYIGGGQAPYAIDKSYVYNAGEIIKGADPETFTIE